MNDLIAKWRKLRGAAASASEVGQRPLYEKWMADCDVSFRPSAETAIFSEDTVVCCKHGIKCDQYYKQGQSIKQDSENSSLWPMFELLRSDSIGDKLIGVPSESTISKKKSFSDFSKKSSRYSREGEKKFQDKDLSGKSAKVKSIRSSKEKSQRQTVPENNYDRMFPETASCLEVLCRFYLGQKSRSGAVPARRIPQSFRLYHQLPEDVSNLDNLTFYAALYIIFVDNDLQCRHLPVLERIVHGKRRFYVGCGDKDAPQFKKLEQLVRHYASNFDYCDRQGRESRFPDIPMGKSR